MEKLLENQGLCHLVRHISSFLDPKSLGRCRVVCHSWKDSIDNDRQWLIYQLEHIQNKEKIFEDRMKLSISKIFPEWDRVIEQFSRKKSIPRLNEFVKHMWIYFNIVDPYGRTPLHVACLKGHFQVVKFLLDNSNEKGIDIFKKDIFLDTAEDLARQKGHTDIVELFEMWTLEKKIERL